MLDVLWSLFGVLVLAGIIATLVWALRRHNRLYPKGRERIRDPDVAQKTRRFETMWTYFSGRSGG